MSAFEKIYNAFVESIKIGDKVTALSAQQIELAKFQHQLEMRIVRLETHMEVLLRQKFQTINDPLLPPPKDNP